MGELKLSPKALAFLRCRARCEFLEGTTYAGKTTLALLKFVLRCAASSRRLHILSGLDTGTIEKNIINKELGILEDFGPLAEYRPAGKGENSAPHILLRTSDGERVIYVLGYDNRARWKKALGGQYGCVYIDEINIADMEYVREAAMRSDYLLATLNPDDPRRPVYAEYIDHARPLPEWAHDTPAPLLAPAVPHAAGGVGPLVFRLWGTTPRSRRRSGGALWRPRPRAPGCTAARSWACAGAARAWCLTCPKAAGSPPAALRSRLDSGEAAFARLACGVDTSYSQRTEDTFAFVFESILTDGRKVTLAAEEHSNRARAAAGQAPLAPSDIPALLEDFLERQRARWGFGRRVFIDSADQAT